MMNTFKLVSNYKPAGDQPEAINRLVVGINNKEKHQVLLGATGTGKTFTIANVIEKVQKPTLVLAHNKTLAGQLYSEFKELFPNNRVEYFVSYYDYYQPEAYVPSSDTYIEKDSSINDEIDELRHGATSALINNKDVIVVASVSCIYGIGEPEEYKKGMLILSVGDNISRNDIIEKLVAMTYERNQLDFHRGTFRVNGDVIDIVPASGRKNGIRVELFGKVVDRISEFDVLTGTILQQIKNISIYPASHFVTSDVKIKEAIKRIEAEAEERLKYFNDNNKLIEEQRLRERIKYDVEMLRETGFCNGIENYARHLALKDVGETPSTLIDFFGDNFLLVVDESHVTLPQVRAMYNGDRSRKQTLVDYGFRLPSALDNRPLKFDEFNNKIDQVIYVSATPGDYELELINNNVVESIIRPTGLVDPTIEVRKTDGQIDDLIHQINIRSQKSERVLITTLTIRMAEELTNYLKQLNIKVAYLHSEVKTFERLKIIRDLRMGKYDVIVGINLLREGLDIPEVSLIAILDADKQGFLRSERSLIQTIGRAARNENGHVIMYADKISDAMNKAIKETNRRREIQINYNKEHGIVPKTIIKEIRDLISNEVKEDNLEEISAKDKKEIILKIEREMRQAAKELDFEKAMQLRDILFEMKTK
ncbi:MAG: excinuclease ABC subunit UvrB [Bacilli bacterium]|nr:excinuclease ABC subunit UvrB [Bacilli bacterium]MDD3895733.1 excinuclease ABC subunit UvrB [Bacilli bacterium]MDD4407788.1 excinuclease ABC subunit UvrB [Bacilli bacterium]